MPFDKSWHDYNESLIERGRIQWMVVSAYAKLVGTFAQVV